MPDAKMCSRGITILAIIFLPLIFRANDTTQSEAFVKVYNCLRRVLLRRRGRGEGGSAHR